MPTKETVIRNEIVRVTGKVKAITVPKEKTQEILKRVELRLFDKKYEVLMPPADDMEKNTIDIQGMMTFIQRYLTMIYKGSGDNTLNVQIVITTTSGSKVNLNYANTVTDNSQGVTSTMQIFGPQNAMSVQYYFIGFDTTNSSYQGNYLELYSSAAVSPGRLLLTGSSPVRIAYANLSISKLPNYDLFILWMIEFQNVPSYIIMFIPTIPGNPSIATRSFVTSQGVPSSFNVYVNNGNCTFTCSGNCPKGNTGNFMISVQNNTIVLQIPVLTLMNNAVSSAEVLICEYANYQYSDYTTVYGFSFSYSTTIVPPSSGYIFVALLTVIAITFTVS
jgi:hypothetical protein